MADRREDPAEDPFEWEDAPSGTRRVSRQEGPRRAGREREAASATRSAAAPERARPRRSRRVRIVSVLALVLAAVLIWFCVELFEPFHGSGHGSVTVTIPSHSSAGTVGDLLERKGVISSSFFFEIRATLGGERGKLRAGTYHLKLGMSYAAALKVLTTRPPPAPVTELTLIEGKSRFQIGQLLHSEGIRGSYRVATRRSALLNPVWYRAPRRTPSLEGFLFPSTYELRKPVSIAALVADQLQTFRERFAAVDMSYARRKHLTPYQVLTVASMIEGEAATARDRPLVASVIYNRLRLGMALQIDATVRYAVDNYTTPITQSQLRTPSPWNTYVHKGLPPTPIDNPGLSTIQAAAHPAQTNFLYFIVKPCGNGEEVFSSSYSQFQADQLRYQAARARRGGRSPASC